MDELFKPQYQGIIFDLDGTLIDSIGDLTDALNRTLAHYNLAPKTYEEGMKLIGRGIRNLVKSALPTELSEDEALVDEATEIMLKEYGSAMVVKTKPYDGITDLLRHLHVHKIPYAICTNKPDAAAKVIVRELFQYDYFVDVVGQNEGVPRKPDPGQTLAICEKMGLKPEECIYMGDSSVDYHTAKNAGMLPVLCTWGFTLAEDLDKYDDAMLVAHPYGVVNALKYGRDMYDVFDRTKSDELVEYREQHKLRAYLRKLKNKK